MKHTKKKYIALRITEDQHQDILHHANKLKITISDMIRLRLFNKS